MLIIVLLIFRTRIIERTEGNGKENTRPRSMYSEVFRHFKSVTFLCVSLDTFFCISKQTLHTRALQIVY